LLTFRLERPLEIGAADSGFTRSGRRYRGTGQLPLRGIECDVPKKESKNMLWTIVAILFALWALGMLTSYTLGGFLHVLLVLALIVFVINLIQGRRSVV
jgi:fatty acid desaturase